MESAKELVRRVLTRRSFRARDGEKGDKMRALVYVGREGKMQMESGIRVPSLKSTQVLIRVHAAALNELDLIKPKVPFLVKDGEPVGIEFVGTIERLGWIGGDHVHLFPFAIGDVVMGVCEGGALAEFVVAEAAKITFKPDDMDDLQAAAFPVSGLTAFHGLRALAPEHNVLVVGAASGTGAMFVKQAKLKGAGKVTAVVRTQDEADLALSCGADEAVLEDEMLGAVPEGSCDIVVDTYVREKPSKKDLPEGAEPEPTMEAKCRPLLNKEGRFLAVFVNNPIDLFRKILSDAIGFNVQRRGFDAVMVQPRTEDLSELTRWFEEQRLVQALDTIVDFEDEAAILAAFERLKAGELLGKVVVRVHEPVVVPRE